MKYALRITAVSSRWVKHTPCAKSWRETQDIGSEKPHISCRFLRLGSLFPDSMHIQYSTLALFCYKGMLNAPLGACIAEIVIMVTVDYRLAMV